MKEFKVGDEFILTDKVDYAYRGRIGVITSIIEKQVFGTFNHPDFLNSKHLGPIDYFTQKWARHLTPLDKEMM